MKTLEEYFDAITYNLIDSGESNIAVNNKKQIGVTDIRWGVTKAGSANYIELMFNPLGSEKIGDIEPFELICYINISDPGKTQAGLKKDLMVKALETCHKLIQVMCNARYLNAPIELNTAEYSTITYDGNKAITECDFSFYCQLTPLPELT